MWEHILGQVRNLSILSAPHQWKRELPDRKGHSYGTKFLPKIA